MERLCRFVRVNQSHPGVSEQASLFYWLRLRRYDRRLVKVR